MADRYKYLTLLWALKKLGCRDIELKTRWTGYRPKQTGFFVGGGKNGFADGQLYAIEFEPPIAYGIGFDLAYWTAEDRNDYRGCNTEATNWRKPQRDFLDKLADIGYELKMYLTRRKERKDKKHVEEPHPVVCN